MGRPPPESASEPDLAPGDMIYLRAFLDLQHDRAGDSITWSAIDRYARRYGFESGQFEKLRETIFEVNSHLNKVLRKRAEEDRERQNRLNR